MIVIQMMIEKKRKGKEKIQMTLINVKYKRKSLE